MPYSSARANTNYGEGEGPQYYVGTQFQNRLKKDGDEQKFNKK